MPIKKLARKFKQVLPDVPIICGGIHVTSLPDETIKQDCFDMLCLGEGEETWSEISKKNKRDNKETPKKK